jgi:hypothetical protein
LKAGGRDSGTSGDCEVNPKSERKEATMSVDTSIPGPLNSVIRIDDERI